MQRSEQQNQTSDKLDKTTYFSIAESGADDSVPLFCVRQLVRNTIYKENEQIMRIILKHTASASNETIKSNIEIGELAIKHPVWGGGLNTDQR